MGESEPGRYVPLSRRLGSACLGLAFFAGPAMLVAGAISARTAGIVDSHARVEARMMRWVGAARAAAAAEGVPAALVLAVASAESSGRPDARSHRGAVGLMQLMPPTAAEVAADRGEPPPRLTDPATSLRLGARYLAWQLRAFAGRAAAQDLALCAYNAGPGRVQGWLAERPIDPAAPIPTSWIPPAYSETRAYVRRVTEWERRWREILGVAPAPSGR